MTSLTVVSWRDIPAQVITKQGRKNVKVLLSPRFQHAIDRAAARIEARFDDEALRQLVRHKGLAKPQ